MQFTNELSALEKSAVKLIQSALASNDLPDTPLFFRRTESYLTIAGAGNKFHPFARLKLNKNLWYISLNCGDVDTDKNFRRFILSDVTEIQNYSNEIVQAFRFSDPQYTEHHFLNIADTPLSPKLKEFFSRMELPTDTAQKYKLTSDEITFFTAYIEELETVGLNWRNSKPCRGSDGTIGVRGGAIRARSKNIKFKYWPDADSIAIWESGLTLDQCISKLSYWVDDCLRSKDIYEM